MRTLKVALLILGISALLSILMFSPVSLKATEIMSTEAFVAMTPYGVPEAHDTDTTKRKKPAIFWGYDANGSVTFADGTNQSAFNASCVPAVMITPISATDTAGTGFEVHIKTVSSTGFDYEVRQNASGSVTDVTATVGVYWVAHGWK